MKVLVIAYVWPEPTSSAAGGRTMEILRVFRQQGWEVVVASAAALSVHREDLSALGIAEKSIALNCTSFDDFIHEFQADIVLFDRFLSEEQFGWRVEKHCPNSLRLLDTCDLHSLRETRHRLFKAQQAKALTTLERQQLAPAPHSREELFMAMAADDLTQREIASIYRCDLSLIISSFEMELLIQQFGVPEYLLCWCNLLLMNQPKNLPSFEQRQGFISIGNFRHAPNWDAVLWLKQVIWPLIHAALPQAQLRICGAYPPPKASALHQPAQGFHVLGWVDDAHAVMTQARVCLAPLRFGAGIKGKLVDALACGTPSVTTAVGSEGMCGDLPWAGVVANDAAAIAQAAINLYQDPMRWQHAQDQGARLLAHYFDSKQSSAALLLALEQALAQKKGKAGSKFYWQYAASPCS
ncbi:MAG: glycosyltransferase family 4 protein [Undibacterium sp.]|nr:glycosyltransferase family 4 protein [Undibacterium sp.]